MRVYVRWLLYVLQLELQVGLHKVLHGWLHVVLLVTLHDVLHKFVTWGVASVVTCDVAWDSTFGVT